MSSPLATGSAANASLSLKAFRFLSQFLSSLPTLGTVLPCQSHQLCVLLLFSPRSPPPHHSFCLQVSCLSACFFSQLSGAIFPASYCLFVLFPCPFLAGPKRRAFCQAGLYQFPAAPAQTAGRAVQEAAAKARATGGGMQDVQQPPAAPPVSGRSTQKVSVSSFSCVLEAICFQFWEFSGVMGKELACPTTCMPLLGTLASSCRCFSCSVVNPKAVLAIQSGVGIQDASLSTCCISEFRSSLAAASH